MRTDRVVVYLDNDVRPQWRWAYRAANGRILADGGESYRRRAACIAGMERVTGGVYDASTQRLTRRVGEVATTVPVVIES